MNGRFGKLVIALLGVCSCLFLPVCAVEELPADDSGANVAQDEVSSGDVLDAVSDSSSQPGDDVGEPDAPAMVMLSEGPLEVVITEDVQPFAISGSGYTGMPSTSYVDYFAGIARKYWGKDYVFFRQNQYTYTLVYNADLELSGTRFSGTGDVVTFYTGSSGNTASLTFGGSQSIDVQLSGVSAYSNLGDFPVFEGVNKIEQTAYLAVILAALCSFVFSLLFARVR